MGVWGLPVLCSPLLGMCTCQHGMGSEKRVHAGRTASAHEEMPPGGPRVCVACRHILFGLWGCFFKKIFLFGPTSKIKHLIKSGLPTSLDKYQNLASGDHSNKPCGGACQHLGHPGIQPPPWSCGLGPYTAVTLCPRLQKGPTSLSAKPPKLRLLP